MFYMDNFFKNKSLAKHSRFGVGGSAEYLFVPKNQKDLVNFLRKLKKVKNNEPITVIGAGSNLLIRDGGVKGIVILTTNLNRVSVKKTRITAECGAMNSKVYNAAKEKGFGGFEFLACIPGTVGGSCRMNAGCYGSEIKDILIRIKTVSPEGILKTFTLNECNLEYRKNNLPDDLIFLEASFKIRNRKDKKEIEQNFKSLIDKKKESQPLDARTCGSTFKNLPDLPAWKVIKEVGLQSVDFNGVRFSTKHANFLVNEKSKSAKDIEDLIDLAKAKAKEKFGVDLELEIKIIGKK